VSGNVTKEFNNVLGSLLHVLEEGADHIEGGMAIILPRHGDASETGVAGWTPNHDDDESLSQSVLMAELLTGMVWVIISTYGGSPDDILRVVEYAIKSSDHVAARPKTLMCAMAGDPN